MQEILKDETGSESLTESLTVSMLALVIVSLLKIWRAWPEVLPGQIAIAAIAGCACAVLVCVLFHGATSMLVPVRKLLSAAVGYVLLLLVMTAVTAIVFLAFRFPVFGIGVLLFLVEMLHRSIAKRKATE